MEGGRQVEWPARACSAVQATQPILASPAQASPPTCSARPSPTNASTVYVAAAPRSVPRAERRPATAGRPAASRANCSYSWASACACWSASPQIACAAWHSCSSAPAWRGSHTLRGQRGGQAAGVSGVDKWMEAGRQRARRRTLASQAKPAKRGAPGGRLRPLVCQDGQLAARLLRPLGKHVAQHAAAAAGGPVHRPAAGAAGGVQRGGAGQAQGGQRGEGAGLKPHVLQPLAQPGLRGRVDVPVGGESRRRAGKRESEKEARLAAKPRGTAHARQGRAPRAAP